MNYITYRAAMDIEFIEGIVPGGKLEFPTIFRTNARPNRLIAFDRAIGAKDTDGWVHFFIHDAKFKRILNDKWRYLPILQRFNGIISPDFSIFWNYPQYRQIESVARNREIGSWLQRNGISVIPCVRWGKEDTYGYAFDGIEPGGTVAVGTAGCMREKEARQVFEKGFPVMLDKLVPKRIVIYGSERSPVIDEARKRKIDVVSFPTETAVVFARRYDNGAR